MVAQHERPVALPVCPENIPVELRERPQWVAWSNEERHSNDGTVTYTKPPLNPRTGSYASVSAPRTWGTFSQAMRYYENGDADGIGYVLTSDDPYTVVDADDCYDASGILYPKAQALIETINSYTETSPSGTGIHILVRSKLPGEGGKSGKLEMYDQRRYITVTGRRIESAPSDIAGNMAEVCRLWESHIAHAGICADEPRKIPESPEVHSDADGALWEQVSPRLKPYQRDIAEGNVENRQGKPYHSASEAEMALLDGLAAQGLTDDEIEAAYLATPFGRARAEHYGEDELRRKLSYGIPKAQGWHEDSEAIAPPPIPIRLMADEESQERRSASRPLFTLYSIEDLLSLPDMAYLVDGLLPEGGVSVIVGDAATYKSFIALNFALSVAVGRAVFGRAVRQGQTLYVAAEGGNGLKNRVRAWMKEHEAEHPKGRFHCITERVQFLEASGIQRLSATITANHLENLSLIVVDTVARAMEGGDENSAKDMGMFVAAIDMLREQTGAHVLLIHHANKGGGMRGSTALRGAIDTQISVVRTDDTVTLRCDKQKDAEEFAPFALKARVVELEDGQRSMVLDVTDTAPSVRSHPGAQSTQPGTSTERVALDVLTTFGSDGATSSEWQRACAQSPYSVKESTFENAKKRLLAKGLVACPNMGERGAKFTVTGEGEGGIAPLKVTPE